MACFKSQPPPPPPPPPTFEPDCERERVQPAKQYHGSQAFLRRCKPNLKGRYGRWGSCLTSAPLITTTSHDAPSFLVLCGSGSSQHICHKCTACSTCTAVFLASHYVSVKGRRQTPLLRKINEEKKPRWLPCQEPTFFLPLQRCCLVRGVREEHDSFPGKKIKKHKET